MISHVLYDENVTTLDRLTVKLTKVLIIYKAVLVIISENNVCGVTFRFT